MLEIRQTEAEKFQPTLYIRPEKNDSAYATALHQAIANLQKDYPGLAVQRNKECWQLVIPDKFREGHESHFARVTQHFLEYLQNHDLPGWEVPGMLAKYYTTTKALEMARKEPSQRHCERSEELRGEPVHRTVARVPREAPVSNEIECEAFEEKAVVVGRRVEIGA